MAASISALQSPLSCRLCRSPPTSSHSPSPRRAFLPPCLFSGKAVSSLGLQGRRPVLEWRRMGTRAVAEEDTLASGGGEAAEAGQEAAPQADQPVSVPVSPSDAEGTMDDSAISNVTNGLEGLEGIGDLKVRVLEGIASVELTKQTTVQATGVASNLVEIIQGAGFKLQTLNLSFGDEEDAAN
ncbi:hypothetical protein Taro_003635 [Colocasia esculenta]|uniref:Uncharacterized protein n=1 Tax=Colocasia esculenta TaxID=4460 RepID=A0A843TM87_COLES|nr:hypothetical protein [Colocasia esculenta]